MARIMERTQSRKWISRIIAAVAIPILLYLGVAFGLSRLLDPEALASWIEPRLERALNREVEVAAVRIGFLPLGIELNQVRISDPTNLAPSLTRLESMALQIELLPLLRKKVRANRLTLKGLDVDLRVSPDGLSNFGDFSTRSQSDPEGSPGPSAQEGPGESSPPLVLDLDNVRVDGGTLRFSRGADSLNVEIEKLALQAAVRRDDSGVWSLSGTSGGDLSIVRSGAESLMDGASIGSSFDVRASPDFSSFSILSSEANLNGLAVQATGQVDGVQDPVRTLSLSLSGEELSLSQVVSTLPPALRAHIPSEIDGRFGLDLRIEGDLGLEQRPEVLGTLVLEEGRMTLNGERVGDGVSATFSLERGMRADAHIQGAALGGPFLMKGAIAFGEERTLDGTIEATMDLERLGAMVPTGGDLSMTGLLDLNTRVTGSFANLRRLSFQGFVVPASVTVSHPSLAVPVGVPDGRIQLAGTGVSTTDLPLILDDDTLYLSGYVPDFWATVDPEMVPNFQGSVHGSRLDLRALSSRTVDSTLTYGKVAFAKVGGRPVEGRSAEEAAEELGLVRPDSLPLSGSLLLALDTVFDRRGRMENLRAEVSFGPGFLQIFDASFNRYGGEILARADLALESGMESPFSFHLEVNELNAETFLNQTTSLGRFANGELSLTLDLVGDLDSFFLPNRQALVGSGEFSFSGGFRSTPLTESVASFLELGSLANPAVEDWNTSFVLENGSVRLAESVLDGAPGKPQIGGRVGLDGGLDLQSIFNLRTETLGATVLERLGAAGELAANVLGRPEVMRAVLRIGGSVFDPAIQADPRAMTAAIGVAAEEEVRNEVQKQQDEALRQIEDQKEKLQTRARGFLQSLLENPPSGQTPTQPDTASASGLQTDTVREDSLGQDTTPADTVTLDSLRADTTRPDTVRPDSLRPDTTRPDTTRPDTVRPDTSGRAASGSEVGTLGG